MWWVRHYHRNDYHQKCKLDAVRVKVLSAILPFLLWWQYLSASAGHLPVTHRKTAQGHEDISRPQDVQLHQDLHPCLHPPSRIPISDPTPQHVRNFCVLRCQPPSLPMLHRCCGTAQLPAGAGDASVPSSFLTWQPRILRDAVKCY